ncbi:MAG: chromosomal replication initiator protein DnaA, partial [Chloroflexia bacterium]|nr:chromosomal replication initiator protein DnaA [Chloroflexia bacterium]
MNLNQIWQAALGTIQMQTSRQEFDTWLRGTTLLALDGGTATVGTSSPFHKEGIETRYITPVRRSLGDVVGYPVQVRIVIANGNGGMLRHELATTTPLVTAADDEAYGNNERAVQLDLSSALRTGMLNPKYTFSRFIVGSSNRMAHAACLAVADNPGQAYNPLFLYGGVGLGKTHLLHAIGNYVLDRDPEINVLYVSSEKFTNDLINAIRRQQTEEFRIRYRNIDVLLIDDIQFIAGKDATQEEFFHTFNALHSAAKHIVISSDKPPKAILTLEERLRSRFEWGLICDVQPPDLETRTAILRAKGEQMNVYIPDEVFDFLAYKVQSNIRELEGSLNRVAAYADLHGLPINVEVATLALADLLGTSRRRRITPEMIIQAVSEHYGIDVRILQGRGRSRNIV